MRKLYPLLLFFLFSHTSLFGWHLKGKVTGEDGEVLSAVKIYLENSSYGTLTNSQGDYSLELSDGTYTVIFKTLSYEPMRKVVTIKGGDQVMDINLKPIMQEAVLITSKKKDPAWYIITQAIKHKKEYIRQWEGFEAKTYLKVSLKTDKERKRKSINQIKREVAKTPKELKAEKKAAKAKQDSIKKVRKDSIAARKDSLKLAKANAVKGDSSNSGGDDFLSQLKEEDDALRKKAEAAREAADSLKGKEEDLPDKLYVDMLVESYSTTYFQRPGKYKSVIHAYMDYVTPGRPDENTVSFTDESLETSTRSTMSDPYLFYKNISEADFNFYRNNVSAPALGARPYISPISTAAKAFYKYKLEEKFLSEGRVIYKIKVTPRSYESSVFEGYIWIVDGLWAIKAVDLKIDKQGLNFFEDFRIQHDYERDPEGIWTMSREEYDYKIKDGKQKYYGKALALYSDFKINPEFPKRFFSNEVRRVEDQAFNLDSTAWAKVRPVTLDTGEATFMAYTDSVKSYYKSDEFLTKLDSSYNNIKFLDFIIFGLGFRNRAKGRELFFNPLIAQIRPFGIGGYRHNFGGFVTKTWTRAHQLKVDYEIDYGFGNQDVKGQGQVSFLYAPKKFGRFRVRAGDRYVMLNSFESIAATFSRGNFVRKTFYGLGNRIELVNGLYLDAGAEYAWRSSIDDIQLSQWSEDLFGGLGVNNTPIAFQNYGEFIIDLKLTYQIKQQYVSEPHRKIVLGSVWPRITLNYRKGIPGPFNSIVDFDFLELQLRGDLPIGTWGQSSYRIFAGQFFLGGDSLQLINQKFFRGSDRFYLSHPLKSFQLLGPSIATFEPYLQLHAQHNFQGALIDKIPLLGRTKLEAVAGASVLLIRKMQIQDAETQLTREINFNHGEAFVGLQYPIRIRRQLMKIGVFFVGANSNYNQVDGTIKFGINFFDTFNNRWWY